MFAKTYRKLLIAYGSTSFLIILGWFIFEFKLTPLSVATIWYQATLHTLMFMVLAAPFGLYAFDMIRKVEQGKSKLSNFFGFMIAVGTAVFTIDEFVNWIGGRLDCGMNCEGDIVAYGSYALISEGLVAFLLIGLPFFLLLWTMHIERLKRS